MAVFCYTCDKEDPMDLSTFEKDWREYEVIFEDGRRFKLREHFFLCIGPFAGGLGFDPGGRQGATLFIFKSDEELNLWQRMKAPDDGPEDEAWALIGKLEHITSS